MDTDRTLLEIFDRLVVGREPDIGAALHAAGYGDLPAELLNQTLVSYCDTAPIEVAAHLAPHVTAVTAGTEPDPTVGFDLLATVPAGATDDLDFGAGGTGPADGFGTAQLAGLVQALDPHVLDHPPTDLHAATFGSVDSGEFHPDPFDTGHDFGAGSWLSHAASGEHTITDHEIADHTIADDPETAADDPGAI
ncbi:hypothetical protein [Skermania piniformis]|uniref:Uncharacterized protein n=1 Tax=Skermania pinensis TaxID=39122 RepID=A0ABX8S6G9_9ACTN|nr:hypothetical protein [Skermania piniformis]QXQ12846.1 hypothetical protein KV203_13035 [Skermania piniformis]